jgi:4-amino-4-deoxy-L-arabinose transferase-like glycosyltransferase
MSQRQLPLRQQHCFDASTLAWLALLAFAVGVYAFGLGGQYIPSIGDELVYTHIARLTAASNHWLPLVSELDHMRNTKPPLLFWQAMVAGDWGQHWRMAALRTPSLIYTLLIAGAVVWTVQQITRNLRTACLAACVYLAFFCTFRFGRTFLTSAPETFWLNAPMFWLLWQRLRQTPATQVNRLGWLAHVGFGVALGLGLAYKSFALIAPAAAALWCAQLLSAPTLSWRVAIQTTLKVSLSAALALGIFALWFVLDPDPAAVWQEFVIGENAGKLSNSQGYWHVALLGGGVSMWAQLLAYAQNAGMLAFVVLGLMWAGLRLGFQSWHERHNKGDTKIQLPAHLWILLAWLAVWLLVFTLPSQRSARYVVPAMPALAMLIALYWERIARTWFLLSLLLCGIFIGVLGRIAWAAHDVGIGSTIELSAALLAVMAGLIVVSSGLLKPAWTRACTVSACLLVYACFSFTTAPLNGAAGQYPSEVTGKLHQAKVAVPNGFNGQFERFQFLLPGNQFVPYDSEGRATAGSTAGELSHLLASHDAVIWLQSEPSEQAPPCLPGCTVLGTRWEVKGRHQSGEITLANLWYPQSWLFRREWLVASAYPPAGAAQR